jgi:hypothetical protein
VILSSPDSDDTFGADEQEEEFSMRDDQFLVSDRTENKFYGGVFLNLAELNTTTVS